MPVFTTGDDNSRQPVRPVCGFRFLLTGSEASWAYPLVWAGFLAVAALAVWAMPLRLEPQGLPLDQAGGGDGEPRATMLPGDKSSGNLKQLAPTVT